MKFNRRSYLIISIGILLILLFVYFFWNHKQSHAQIEARLGQAKVNVNNVGEVFRQSMESEFVVLQKQTTNDSCEEKSSDLSFTRIYDCNATIEFTLSSAQGISTDHTKLLIRTALNKLGVPSGTPEELNNYIEFINDTGSWHTLQPFSVPHTRIAGVPPFNYYGGAGQEDVGLHLESKYLSDSKKITLHVIVIQEYHSCKSFFLPC